jgi:ribonuclease E
VPERAVPTKLSLPNIAAPNIAAPNIAAPSVTANVLPPKAIAEPIQELDAVIDAEPVVAPENAPDRPNKREIRTKVIEPPELIVVEMTEEEQDVYSLIGISPLVLVDREVKDPRNVIVTVALPGQPPKVANNLGNLRSIAELSFDLVPESSLGSNTESSFESSAESSFDSNISAETEDNFAESSAELEIIESSPEDISDSVTGLVKVNPSSSGVILRVNRPQLFESEDADENLEIKFESVETSKESAPIQSPEASRRKRSSAS